MKSFSRRNFLASASCGAYVAGLASLAPAMTRKVFSIQDQEKIVAREKWGRIEKLADHFWAVVSTPFEKQDFATVCNGGIIAGKDRVIAIESYMQPNGAGWVGKWAKKLTGRWPTDIVVSHFHADHSGGASGFFSDGEKPNLWVTKATHDNIQKDIAAKNKKLPKDKQQEYPGVKILPGDKSTVLDLGGKKVKVQPRSGHTSSDVTVELVDPNMIFCGDLFFNRMIPNYRDSLPRILSEVAARLSKTRDTVFVPGHGPVGDHKDMVRYKDFLDYMETTAKAFFDQGKTAAEAAGEFKLSEQYEDWFIFSNQVVPRAMSAWYREFKNSKG